MTDDDARAYAGERLTPEQFSQVETLVDLLAKENERQNLVSRETLSQVWARHVVDSLQLSPFLGETSSSGIDLGSGAGFPGLVLAIARPEIKFDLVDSRRLRVEWLTSAIAALQLRNCRAIQSKVERWEGQYDVITARAFAPLERLVAVSEHLAHGSSLWVLPKGKNGTSELAKLKRPDMMFHVEQSESSSESSILIGRYR